MNIQRIAAVMLKEWREIVRDRLFFILAFVVPASFMLLFGYGLSMDVEDIPMAVLDQDNTPLSRDYAYRFMGSRYFDFKGMTPSLKQAEPLLLDNKLRLILIIPDKFQENIIAGRTAEVQTIIDGTFPFRAQTSKGYVAAINGEANMELLAKVLAKKAGMTQEAAREAVQPVKLAVRYLYNQSCQSIWSMAPKIMMVILMITPPFLTALGIVREKETGSIYNIYASTVTRPEFLLGKLTPYAVISVLNMLILWLFAVRLFGAPFKGNVVFFSLASILYVVCTTGIGLIISVLVRTQTAAMVMTAILTIAPSVLYSGVIIPVSSMGDAAQFAASTLPATYYTEVVLGCFLKGVGWSILWSRIAILGIYAIGLFSIGYVMFSKRPSR
ncbi:ABC transporter permease [Desulfatibacillum aliphaticivorans]|uniref:ABC transporter permease n=1 Tax=Desulfatibacillum aliphaticivorans TaxID=218208 RepID=UPI00040F2874|nr:ABC transporter permease [Desulfatibacillum aliphaticivorans]